MFSCIMRLRFFFFHWSCIIFCFSLNQFFLAKLVNKFLICSCLNRCYNRRIRIMRFFAAITHISFNWSSISLNNRLLNLNFSLLYSKCIQYCAALILFCISFHLCKTRILNWCWFFGGKIRCFPTIQLCSFLACFIIIK